MLRKDYRRTGFWRLSNYWFCIKRGNMKINEWMRRKALAMVRAKNE